MKSRLTAVAVALTTLYTSVALAGSSPNGGPAGDSGSSGSEPEMIALICFSVIPGIFFARKALRQRALMSKDLD